MADDDFWSDDESAAKKKEAAAGAADDTLAPIIEVSSEASTAVSTARSDSSTVQGSPRSDDDDKSSDDDDDDDDDTTPRSSSSRASGRRRRRSGSGVKRGGGANGRYPVDLTPPDKLLKRAEKKARRYTKHNRGTDAVRELIRCTALARIVHGEGAWRVARAHANLAAAYLDLKGYAAQAQYHAELARGVMVGGVHTASSGGDARAAVLETLCSVYYTLGRALTALKKYSEAEQHLLKAEKISEERSKVPSVSDDSLDDWDTNVYTAIARCAGRAGKPAQARSYLEKALEIVEDRFGSDSSRLIPIYQSLGSVEQSRGADADHERAVEMFLKAHTISTNKYADNSPEVAETARALAAAYSNVGAEDAETSAESYLNECLAIYAVHHGPNHRKTIDVQDELAKIMIRTDRQTEGVELLRSTLEPKAEVFGEFSPEVAETLKLIGSVQLSQGDAGKALKTLKKCHDMETLVYGANSKKSRDTQKTIDLLLANPTLAAKHKTIADAMKERPRFNSVVSRGTALGGFRPQAF